MHCGIRGWLIVCLIAPPLENRFESAGVTFFPCWFAFVCPPPLPSAAPPSPPPPPPASAAALRWAHPVALPGAAADGHVAMSSARLSSPPPPLASVCLPAENLDQTHPTTLRHSTPTRSHSSTAHAALCPLDWMSESAGQRGAAAAAASSAAAAGVSRARAARPTRKLEGASAAIDSDDPIDLVSDADLADVWGASSGGESDSDEAADRREAREDDMRRRVDHTKTFRTTRGWPRKMASGQRWREVSRKRTKESAQPASQLGQPASSA